MDGLKISAVSYLNTKPFLFGINQSGLIEKYNLIIQTDLPSVCAEKLMNNQVDIGLVPVAVLPELKKYELISDYCIGAEGPVKTVMLYSQVPLEEIKTIYLDYQSKTSVLLARVLAKELWHIAPEFTPAFKGYETQIKENRAGVVIGDRTFLLNNTFKYEFDLAEEWKKLTGLPFVFAAWVANKEIDKTFIKEFNLALKNGLSSIASVAETYHDPVIDLEEYFTKYISYDFTPEKKQALDLFLEKIKNL
jgi:chorismate dehydratase